MRIYFEVSTDVLRVTHIPAAAVAVAGSCTSGYRRSCMHQVGPALPEHQTRAA